MIQKKNYIIFILLAFFLSACNLKRHVPNDEYLLVSNQVHLPSKTEVNKSDVEDVIRQRPNHKTLWFFNLRLGIYNSIDSTKVAKSKIKRIENYRRKNKRKLARQERINERRIERAIKRGDSLYTHKTIELKDTIQPRPTLRERIKYDWGEPPVIYDSSQTQLSKEQIELFMNKKGYFDATVETEVDLNSKKQEAKVHYHIVPQEKYMVDSMFLRTNNTVIQTLYDVYLEEGENVLIPPFRFDSNELGKMRRSIAEFLRNRGLYGFRESYISFEVDTLGKNYNIHVAVDISERIIEKDGEEIVKPFAYTKVRNVSFHLLDTMKYKGNFQKDYLDPRGITLRTHDQIPTFDTLRYDWYNKKNKEFRTATFLFNGEPTTKVELIEFQNYLEENNVYRGDYLGQSYNRLMNLNIFKTVVPEIIENEDNTIDVRYFLMPQKQRTFSFEPQGTHSNSFLGVSASLNYVNRNLFDKGHRFKASISGGFESNPLLFSDEDEKAVLNEEASFNTIEIGPYIEFEMPGLYPIPLSNLSKRQNPSTTIGLAYNYQKRIDFRRQTIQWNYLWKFQDVYRTQRFTVGIPVIGGIQFVRIDEISDQFRERLEQQNDLFLLSAYSNQAIYKDVGVTYSYTNPNIRGGLTTFNYNGAFDVAGMIIGLITDKKEPNEEGYKEFLGQRYSQFVRLDNQLVLNQHIDRISSLHYRLQAGVGIPLKNNGPSLPFDYSFFGGGSNDNRGYSARTLGPGVYKYYLDTTRTSTQMGDVRLGASLEYRFKMTKLFEGAFFADAGNLWSLNEDPNRVGGHITKDFYKQLSISAGLGLRLDFTYVIIRLDMGIPLRNPALPDGAKWIWQDRQPYYQEGIDAWGINPETNDYYYKDKFPNPFRPRFHLAIGYPF